jgi:molybdate transport system permease protein
VTADAPLDLSALWLSLQVAGTATLLILPFGVLTAWWLAYGRPFRGKGLIETFFILPLVLPPTVVGYGLLLLLGRGTRWGEWLNDSAGIRLLFTWQGAALAASVMAFPLFLRTASAAFASVESDLLEAGRTLGATEWDLLRRVILPLSYRGLFAGLALAFARALGEFGATLMVAGSIPGRTQTLPLALYASVQGGKDQEALAAALLLTTTAFLLLGVLQLYEKHIGRRQGQ